MTMKLLCQHAASITLVSRDPVLGSAVRRYFNLREDGALLPLLLSRGLGQADLVLCLLRVGGDAARWHVEIIVGRPILILPCVRCQPLTRAARAARVAWVAPCNPRKPGSRAHAAFGAMRPGATVEALRARGVRTRDITYALRRGLIKMEEAS